MTTPSERRALGHRLPAREGVYALYEEGVPMYVGRSNNLKIRLLDHWLPSGTAGTATLALRMA